MNKEKIEELAFKDRKELANLNELDLLEIIEFLQLDRKQWINQYSAAHNDYVDLQQENKKLKEELKYTVPIVEHNKIVSKKLKENQKYKEVIDKAIEYINENLTISSILDGKKYYTINNYSFDYIELLDILKEVE